MYTLDMSTRDYGDYVEEHMSNVRKAWNDLFLPYYSAGDDEARELAGVDADTLYDALVESESLVAIHDASKYDDEEFEPYRIHFYPTPEEKDAIERGSYDDKAAFTEAFAHHCRLNPHHAQHWCDEDGLPVADMELPYIIEMVCDWAAMSMKFGGSPLDWWRDAADKERRCMTDGTIEVVDQMMDTLFR